MFEYLFALMLIDLMESFYFLGKWSFHFAIIFPFCWNSKNIIKSWEKDKWNRNKWEKKYLSLIEKTTKR